MDTENSATRRAVPVGELATDMAMLASDPGFLQLEEWLNTPNLFEIVGKLDSERWHSAFWSWVLDPRGSHGQGAFAISRLLLKAVTDDGSVRCCTHSPTPRHLSAADLLSLDVDENRSLVAPGRQTDYDEIGPDLTALGHSVPADEIHLSKRERGLFDCLTLIRCRGADGNEFTLAVVVEFKVTAPYSAEQLKDYSEWHMKRPPEARYLLAEDGVTDATAGLLAPDVPIHSFGFFVGKRTTRFGKQSPPDQLDPPWTRLSYEDLIKVLLDPMLSLPALPSRARFMIEAYIDDATKPYGVASAHRASQQQTAAKALWGKHRRTFVAMNGVLAGTGQEGDPGEETLAKRSSPELLINAGLMKENDQVRHKPVKQHGQDHRFIEDDIVAKLVPTDKGWRFKWVSGGRFTIEGFHTATGLLTAVYREHGGKSHLSGNEGWSFGGRKLAELYKEAEMLPGLAGEPDADVTAEPAWKPAHREVVDTFLRRHRDVFELIDAICGFDDVGLGILSETLKSESPTERDFTKYMFEGAAYGKGRLVMAVVQKFVQDKQPTLEQVNAAFPANLQGSLGVVTSADQARVIETRDRPRHFMEQDELLTTSDGHLLAVCSQWKVGNIGQFIERAKELGYLIQ
jgi:hypothetical protein